MNYAYPAAGANAPAGVRRAIRHFRRLPEEVKRRLPLLYFLLGDSTPPYKMSGPDAAYQGHPAAQQQCSNCTFAYQHVTTGNFICSQIRPAIQPEAWCRLWQPED